MRRANCALDAATCATLVLAQPLGFPYYEGHAAGRYDPFLDDRTRSDLHLLFGGMTHSWRHLGVRPRRPLSAAVLRLGSPASEA
jgi:hypothetical protein